MLVIILGHCGAPIFLKDKLSLVGFVNRGTCVKGFLNFAGTSLSSNSSAGNMKNLINDPMSVPNVTCVGL